VPAGEFFEGTWTTALDDDELLAAVTFPIWSGRCGFAVEELARRHGDFAIAGAAVAVEVGDDDRVRRCGIGLFGLGSTPERAPAAEAEVVGEAARDIDADEVGRMAISTLESVPTDLHGSADYRRRVGAAMVARAWRTASEEALHG
jgi:carbon-monoxide dehydrogenase medium subunit